MSVALQDERTPIGVTDALGNSLGPIPGAAHQADRGVPMLVEAQRVVACFDRGLPQVPAHAVPRIANALIAVVSAIDGTREVAQGRPSRAELLQLLDDVR